MTRKERTLVLFLRFNAVILLTAMAPAAMPLGWMAAIHRALGLGELPEGLIVSYLTRSLSAMYAMHGALVYFVSLDVRRYLPVARCLASGMAGCRLRRRNVGSRRLDRHADIVDGLRRPRCYRDRRHHPRAGAAAGRLTSQPAKPAEDSLSAIGGKSLKATCPPCLPFRGLSGTRQSVGLLAGYVGSTSFPAAY